MKVNKNILVWILIAVGIGFLVNWFDQKPGSKGGVQKVPYSTFISDVEKGNVEKVSIVGNDIKGKLRNGSTFKTFAPNDSTLVQRLIDKSVIVSASELDDEMPAFLAVLLNWFPMLLLIAVWIFFMRGMGGGANKALGMGKSRAKLLNENTKKVTFDDVAGIDEAKEDLQETVDFLRDPKKYQRLGGKLPREIGRAHV